MDIIVLNELNRTGNSTAWASCDKAQFNTVQVQDTSKIVNQEQS